MTPPLGAHSHVMSASRYARICECHCSARCRGWNPKKKGVPTSGPTKTPTRAPTRVPTRVPTNVHFPEGVLGSAHESLHESGQFSHVLFSHVLFVAHFWDCESGPIFHPQPTSLLILLLEPGSERKVLTKET